MGPKTVQPAWGTVWGLVGRQHGVIARSQLIDAGYSSDAIRHRLVAGKLHRVGTGVYAVGRPQLTAYGRWTAAVLSCGREAALSHESAAALWRIRAITDAGIEVSVPAGKRPRRRQGLVIHRRSTFYAITRHRGIPVTTPVYTLIDIASRLTRHELEAAVNEADKLDLTDPEELRAALDAVARRPGIKVLREVLDRRTFTITDSELERRFLPIARAAGLPLPQTGCQLNGFKVDFYWPDSGLVVETDGLRYHRTATQQTADRVRDQVHAAAGLTTLRFTHAQVRFEPDHVRATLAAVRSRQDAKR